MCGIIGYLGKERIESETFRSMRDTMIHRGPDAAGEKYFREGCVALGHRRLSIIGLSESGAQPMSNEEGTLWLTFNGEIYNYLELKKLLISLGHIFKSETDSEVLIHGFEEWGLEVLLQKLRGMFAFALYNTENCKLYAARDRFGIKPFTYYYDEEQFIFASEIKAILSAKVDKTIRDNFLSEYFTYGYVPHPNTPWQKIFKLSPGYFLSYDYNDSELELTKYWELACDNKKVSREEAIKVSSKLLDDSIKEHLTSDVPVGLFLSGGYDSTSILNYTSRIQPGMPTFSLGFQNSKNSEHTLAKEIADIYKSPNEHIVLSENEKYWDTIMEQSKFYDEPYAISSKIPYYYVSKLAAKKHKVILGGDGGDEVFAGYRWHYEIPEKMDSRSWKSIIKDMVKGERHRVLIYYNKHMNGYRNHSELEKDISKPSILDNIRNNKHKYFEKYYKRDLALVKRLQYLDTKTFLLEACLTRADQTSMIHSLETRLPFLDHRLVEYTFSLDPSVYFDFSQKKILLKHQIKPNVPDYILDQPKRGFGFQQLYTLFGDSFELLMKNSELEKAGIIKKDLDWSSITMRLRYQLLNLELWYKRFVNG